MFNKFSLLHVASGIIAYFWGLPLVWWIVIHALFEYAENTNMGIKFINRYVPLWPGGKQEKETFVNSMIGDNVSAVLGWMLASFVENKKIVLTKRTGETKFKSVMSK